MNRPTSNANPTPARTSPCNQGLIALSLLCLLLAIFSSIGWLESKKQVSALRTELELAQCSLTDTRQHLEAEQLISRGQLQMIRNQQRLPPSKP